MKYKLFSSQTDWDNTHNSIKSFLGLPTATTDQYAVISEVDNSEHSDFGKYIFPVKTTGVWKCDDQFNSEDLVDYQDSWFAIIF